MSVGIASKERLLEEALAAGLTGEQRRVQTALLRTTRAQLAAERHGWPLFEPNASWYRGHVEDPRFLHGRVRSLSLGLAVAAAALAGAILASRWEPLQAAAVAIVLLAGLQAALHGILGRIAEERDRSRLQAGQPELLVFNAPLPAPAAAAYKRARESRLFDTFLVCSPRAEDFRSVAAAQAPSLGLLDPVLIGRIGDETFLIAQWDLAQDLASL